MNKTSYALLAILISLVTFTFVDSILSPSADDYAFTNAVADEVCKQENSGFSRFEIDFDKIIGIYCTNGEFVDSETLETKSNEVSYRKAYDIYRTYYHNIL